MLRAENVNVNVAKLVMDEYEKRQADPSWGCIDRPQLDLLERDHLLERFCVASDEEDMVRVIRQNVELHQPAFDIIVSSFGCDIKCLSSSAPNLFCHEEKASLKSPETFETFQKSPPQLMQIEKTQIKNRSNSSSTLLHTSTALNMESSSELQKKCENQILVQNGNHMCQKVTTALQNEMRKSSLSGDTNLSSICAPVIVYSTENQLSDIKIWKQLAFRCERQYTVVFTICDILQQMRGSRWRAAGIFLSFKFIMRLLKDVHPGFATTPDEIFSEIDRISG